MQTIYGLLEKDNNAGQRKIDRFHEVLRNLRFEGKMHFRRNLSEAGRLESFFERSLRNHMKGEEEVLFPYLQKHIPRLEPVVYLLQTEHDDFRFCLEELKGCLSACAAPGAIHAGTVEKVYDRGIHFICLWRSHMGCESHGLYEAAERELRPAEKRQLLKRI
jgi:hemerythrin-like domain-containing protein